jgi:hypothetical protein
MWTFVSGRPFQSSLVFEEKARSLPRRGGTPLRYASALEANITHGRKSLLKTNTNFIAQSLVTKEKVFLIQPQLRLN